MPLAAPDPDKRIDGATYSLIPNSSRVEGGWQELSQNHKEAAQRCYEHLVINPFRRIPRRVYPLKGKRLKGIWEYEVTGSERLFYKPDAETRRVLILKVGGHCSL